MMPCRAPQDRWQATAKGELRSGVDIVIDSVKLARQLKGSDLVITGEGRMDHQTAFGKTPAGVAKAPTDQVASPSLALSLRKQASYARDQIGERRIRH